MQVTALRKPNAKPACKNQEPTKFSKRPVIYESVDPLILDTQKAGENWLKAAEQIFRSDSWASPSPTAAGKHSGAWKLTVGT